MKKFVVGISLLFVVGMLGTGCGSAGPAATVTVEADKGVKTSIKIKTFWTGKGCLGAPYINQCSDIKELTVGGSHHYAYREGIKEMKFAVACNDSGVSLRSRHTSSGPGYEHTIIIKDSKVRIESRKPGQTLGKTITDLSGCIDR